MDIITNLFTAPLPEISQSSDLSGNFIDQIESELPVEELEQELPESAMMLFDGTPLPPSGNKTPISFDFNAVLKNEVLNTQSEKLTQSSMLLAQNAELEASKDFLPILPEKNPQQKTEHITNNMTSEYRVANLEQDLRQSLQLKEMSAPNHPEMTPLMQVVTATPLNSELATSTLLLDKGLESKKEALTFTEALAPSEIKEQPKEIIQNAKVKALTLKEASLSEKEPNMAFTENDSLEKPENSNREEGADFQLSYPQVASRKNEQAVPSQSEKTISRETFEQDLSEKLQLLLNTKGNTAQVEVSPAELGTIEIKIVQEADKTHIIFIATQLETQELIEASLDRLKTQVEMHGLNLGNVTVSHGDAQQQQHLAKQRFTSVEQQEQATDEPVVTSHRNQSPNSTLDLYA